MDNSKSTSADTTPCNHGPGRRSITRLLVYVLVVTMASIICMVAMVSAAFAEQAQSSQVKETDNQINLPDLGTPGGDALPIHKERELGNEIMKKVRSHMRLHKDIEINQYINDLGQRLAAHSHAPLFDYQFFVVEDASINAFALPGGHIGINSGLIRETESESELAGVLAHEIAHVTERHIARQFAQSQRLNLQTAASILAAIFIGAHNPQAGSAAAMAGIAAPLQQQLSHSREHEREADRLGAQILSEAKFDPQGMPGFFERLTELSRNSEKMPEYLRTHPLTQSRLSKARSIADRLQGGEILESGHHAFIRARLEVFARLDKRESAVAHMADRVQKSTQHPSARAGAIYGLALALAHEQQAYDKALALLDNLQAIDGERLYVLLGRAEIHRLAGRPQQALEVYDQVLSLYPSNPAAIYRHAETLLATGQAEQARRALASATRRDDTRTLDLIRLYAEAAHASGNQGESHIAYARYHYLRGNISMALSQLDNAMRAGQSDYHQARASALYDRWRGRHSPNQAQPRDE